MTDPRERIRVVLTVSGCVALTGFGVFALLAPRTWLFTQPLTVATSAIVAALVGILSLALACVTRRPIVADVVLVIAAATMIAAARLEVGLGDDSWRVLATDESRELWVSSYLSHLALRVIFRFRIDLELIGIGLAVASLIASLVILRVSMPSPRDGWSLFATRATILTLAMWLVFVDGLVETTPFSVPVGLLGLAALIRWEQGRSMASLTTAATLVAFASTFHGQWLVAVPMVLAVVVLQTTSPMRDLLTSTAAMIAVVAVVAVVTVPLLGYRPTPGDSRGGGDAQILPPDLLSVAHLTRIGSILVLASPLVVVAVLACLGRRDRRRPSTSAVLAALAYLGFIAVWHFDFGYPKDLDLMVSMGGLLLPLLAAAVMSLKPMPAAVVVAVAAAANAVLLTAVVS